MKHNIKIINRQTSHNDTLSDQRPDHSRALVPDYIISQLGRFKSGFTTFRVRTHTVVLFFTPKAPTGTN